MPTNQDSILLKSWKCSAKKAINATYDEAIEMWKKVADDASPSYTCYVSRNTVRKKRSNLYQMLKKARDPIPKRKFFDTSKDINQRLCVKDYNFILDQKGLGQATFGEKGVKLVKKTEAQVIPGRKI